MASQLQEDIYIAAQVSTELARSHMPEDSDTQDRDEATQLLGATTASSPTSKNRVRMNYQAISDESLSPASSTREEYAAGDNDEDEADEEEDSVKLKKDLQHLPWTKRPSVKLLMVIMLTIILGSTASATSKMDAVVFLICKDYYNALEEVSPANSTIAAVMGAVTSGPPLSLTDPRCLAPEVMASVGVFQTYTSTISAILSVFTVPLWASYSDRVGRRPIMLLGISCFAITDAISLTCFIKSDVFNYRWLIASGFVEGMCGSVSLVIIMCSSYISDCIKETYRAGVLSVFDAWIYAGLALGPLVGSFILETTKRNLVTLFLFSIVLDLVLLLTVLALLPELRSERSRRKSVGAHLARHRSFLNEQRSRRMPAAAVPVNDADSEYVEDYSSRLWTKTGLVEKFQELVHSANILEPLKVLKFTNLPDKRARRNVYILIVGQATIGEALTAAMTFMLLYAKSRFGFTSVENNYFISLMGTSRFVILSLVFPQILKAARARWPHSPTRIDYIDKRIMQMGLTCSTLGVLTMAEAPTSTLFLCSVMIIALGAGTSPLVRNAIIKHAPKNKVGEVLGAANVLGKMQGIVTPMIFAAIYNYTIKFRAQAIVEAVVLLEVLLFSAMSCLYVQHQIPSIDDVEAMVQA